jgi:AmmeMemoRadiSam system protein A
MGHPLETRPTARAKEVSEMSFDVLGIIAPHPPIMVDEVGASEAKVTHASADAMRQLALLLERFAPQTLVVVSPHAPSFSDAFTATTATRLRGDLGGFRAPQIVRDVAGDPALAAAIIQEASAAGLPTVSREEYAPRLDPALDHGVMVPLYFLDPTGSYPLVVVSFTGLPAEDHAAFGRAIRHAAERVGRRIALVASGDLSHRLLPSAPAGYSPRAHFFDEELMRLLSKQDFHGLATMDTDLREEAGECGWRSFLILGGYLEGSDATGRVLSYEGPWGVGYLTAAFAPAEELADLPAFTPLTGAKGGTKGNDASEPVRLARATIEQYVREGTTPEPVPFTDPALPARAGAFVSLHIHDMLRGCIGTIAPTQSTLAAEIVHNAVQAATADPRFPRLAEHELDDLDIKVDVLHAPESVDSLASLDPKVYGVITTCGWRRGLLLPDLEGVDTCEEQVAIAMSKGSIRPDETISLERFKVDRYA